MSLGQNQGVGKPAVRQRELCSMPCASWMGGGWGRMDAYTWMAESLLCASETITLLIGYAPTQNGFGVKKIKIKLKKNSRSWQDHTLAGGSREEPAPASRSLWWPRRAGGCVAPASAQPPGCLSCVSDPPPHLSHQDAWDRTEGPPGVNLEHPPSSGFFPSARWPRRDNSELPGLGPRGPSGAPCTGGRTPCP